MADVLNRRLTRRALTRVAMISAGSGIGALLIQACGSSAPAAPTTAPASTNAVATAASQPTSTPASRPTTASAVQPTSTPAAQSAPTAQATTAANAATGRGGTLVFGFPQKTSYDNLAPWYTNAGNGDIYLRRLVTGSLLVANEDLTQWLPDLAESWEFSGSQITFKLRKGVTWHDGQPFKANDVLFSVKVNAHASNDVLETTFFDMIAGLADFRKGKTDQVPAVTAPDDYTVVVQMTQPYREPFLSQFSTVAIVPEHILGSIPMSTWKDGALLKSDYVLKKAIGTGPFMITNYVVDQYIEYAPFPNYWRGVPLLDKLIFKTFANQNAQNAAIEKGEVHIGSISPTETARFQKMSNVNVLVKPGLSINAFELNIQLPYLSDKRVRQAMLYSLDRDTICKSIYSGVVTPPAAPIMYAKYGVSPNVHKYTYDPAQAQQLLKNANWDPNRSLRILVEAIAPADEPFYALIRGYWDKAGIKTEFQVAGANANKIEYETFDTDIDFSAYSWGTTPYDSVHFFFDSANTISRNHDTEAIDLVNKFATSEDEDAKKGYVWRMQELAAENAVVLPIGQSPRVWAINKKVQGNPTPHYALWTHNYWHPEKWWVAP